MEVPVYRGTAGMVAYYDANEARREHREWALGAFITGPDQKPLTEDFEVKWAKLKAGEVREEWPVEQTGKSLIIVLSGAHEFTVAPNGPNGSVIARILRAGEAVFWENSVPHRWRVVEDSETITIRCL